MILNLLAEDDSFLKLPTPTFDTKGEAPMDGQAEFMHELAINLVETMLHHKAIGLAANQVGMPYRVFVQLTDISWRACFNPHVVNTIGDLETDDEGCLSFPDLTLRVKRQPTIQVAFTDEKAVDHVITLTGMEARVFQHELDHLNGVTFDTHVGSFALKRAKERRKKHAKS
jgi:peptide deformylase